MAQTLIDIRMIKDITATTTELNYVYGVTSQLQTSFAGESLPGGDETVAGIKTF